MLLDSIINEVDPSWNEFISNKEVQLELKKIENKLQSHLLEVQKNAKKEYEMLMKELKIKENITEELKEKDQMKWVGLMNNISNIADEIVIKKYVYEE